MVAKKENSNFDPGEAFDLFVIACVLIFFVVAFVIGVFHELMQLW